MFYDTNSYYTKIFGYFSRILFCYFVYNRRQRAKKQMLARIIHLFANRPQFTVCDQSFLTYLWQFEYSLVHSPPATHQNHFIIAELIPSQQFSFTDTSQFIHIDFTLELTYTILMKACTRDIPTVRSNKVAKFSETKEWEWNECARTVCMVDFICFIYFCVYLALSSSHA